MEHEVVVPLPAADVRRTLQDRELLVRCVPGLSTDAASGRSAGGETDGRLKLRVGGATITYRGSLSLIEGREGVLTAFAEGQEVRGSGEATATLRISVREHPQGSALAFTGDLSADGRLADFDGDALAAAGRRLLDRFAAALAVEAGAPVAAVAEAVPDETGPDEAGSVQDEAVQDEAGAGAVEDEAEAGAAGRVEEVQAAATEREPAQAEPDAAPSAAVAEPAAEEPAAAAAAEPADAEQPPSAVEAVEGTVGTEAEAAAEAEAEAAEEAAPEDAEAEAEAEAEAAEEAAPEDEAGEKPADGEDGEDEEKEEGPDATVVYLDDRAVDDLDDDLSDLIAFTDDEPLPAPEPATPFDYETEPALSGPVRRSIVGRSAEEVDHAPPHGRYAPTPPSRSARARAASRWGGAEPKLLTGGAGGRSAVPWVIGGGVALVGGAVVLVRALRRR